MQENDPGINEVLLTEFTAWFGLEGNLKMIQFQLLQWAGTAPTGSEQDLCKITSSDEEFSEWPWVFSPGGVFLSLCGVKIELFQDLIHPISALLAGIDQ